MQAARIMVVETDDYSAMLTRAALAAGGYRIEAFIDADIALEALADAPARYQAVVAHESVAARTGRDLSRYPHLVQVLLVENGQRSLAPAEGFHVSVSRDSLGDGAWRFFQALGEAIQILVHRDQPRRLEPA